MSFASKSELAVGLLLEKYIPDFEMIPGKTFQVPLAFGKQCDFRIGHLYLEYHPVNLQFDFKDKQALHELRKGLRHVKKPFKEQIVESFGKELRIETKKQPTFIMNWDFLITPLWKLL